MAPIERPETRQYRYVLATADFATLSLLHREALAVLDPLVRANVLRTARERLHSGYELTVDDTAQLAHLITVGELRAPGRLCSGLESAALERLAHAVLRNAEPRGVLEGYDEWDGQDADAQGSVARLAQRAMGTGA